MINICFLILPTSLKELYCLKDKITAGIFSFCKSVLSLYNHILHPFSRCIKWLQLTKKLEQNDLPSNEFLFSAYFYQQTILLTRQT
jgi:hypothetical protein